MRYQKSFASAEEAEMFAATQATISSVTAVSKPTLVKGRSGRAQRAYTTKKVNVAKMEEALTSQDMADLSAHITKRGWCSYHPKEKWCSCPFEYGPERLPASLAPAFERLRALCVEEVEEVEELDPGTPDTPDTWVVTFKVNEGHYKYDGGVNA